MNVRRTVRGVAAVVVTAISVFAMTGCEPTGWDLVLEAPNPPRDVAAAYDPLSGDISVTFTIPQLNEVQRNPSVVVYYRLTATDEPVYAGGGNLGESATAGSDHSVTFGHPAEMTVGGTGTVIVELQDNEYQPSEPVEVSIDWAP